MGFMARGRGFTVRILTLLLAIHVASAVRDYSVDRLTLDPTDDPEDLLPAVEEAAQEDASYVDCLRHWEEERRRQFAFMEGFTHLVSAERRVQRLHVSLRSLGPGRNLAVLVTDLQQRLSVLSRAGLRYAERLKHHVDELHPRMSERCKNSTLDVEDLRKEVLSALTSRGRAGTLAKLKADVQQHTAEYEQQRLAKGAEDLPEAVNAKPLERSPSQRSEPPLAVAESPTEAVAGDQAAAKEAAPEELAAAEAMEAPEQAEAEESAREAVGEGTTSSPSVAATESTTVSTGTTTGNKQTAESPVVQNSAPQAKQAAGDGTATTSSPKEAAQATESTPTPASTGTTASNTLTAESPVVQNSAPQAKQAAGDGTANTSSPNEAAQATESTQTPARTDTEQIAKSPAVQNITEAKEAPGNVANTTSPTAAQATESAQNPVANTGAVAPIVVHGGPPAPMENGTETSNDSEGNVSNESEVNTTRNASNASEERSAEQLMVAMATSTDPKIAADTATLVLSKTAGDAVDPTVHQGVVEELQQCKLANNFQDVKLANDPTKLTLPCLLGAPIIRCSPWVFEPQKASLLWSRKIKLQSYWILLLGAILISIFAFSWYRQQMKKHTKEALGKKSKEQLQAMEERAVSSQFYSFFGGILETSVVVMVVDVISALIPISNVVIYGLATEDLMESKVALLERSLLAGPVASFCARLHDGWMLASMIVLILFQVVRALAAQQHHPYNAYGRFAWLVYLATDISAMGDTVAILLTAWSLCYCRSVRWNWMIFSFIRVIESLGRWGIGVNFYGFSEEVNEDQRMIRALAVFGFVIWILIGSLYYVGNSENEHSKWEYANVITDEDDGLPKWQRFESIPSSMFFALLTLNKKNPLAHVFVTWYEKLMVVFVNVCCVPLFSLVSSMIGGTIMQLVLSQEKETETPTEAGAGATAEQLDEDVEEEEEEEEEEEIDEEVPDEAVEEPEEFVPLWQRCQDFVESLTWEDHLHPAAVAFFGFGSLFFYGLSTAHRKMKWLFFEFNAMPPWAFPVVDGLVGALFLADWLHSSVIPRRKRSEAELAAELSDAEAPEPEAARASDASAAFQSMSLWRHLAYFLSSVPGMVNFLLCVLEAAVSDFKDVGKGMQFYCLCCLWRIFLLERWLDHPFSAAMDAMYTCRKQLVTTGAVSLFFWFLGAHLLFFTEYENPDSKIREFYGSVMRSIWASSFYLNGEWVFCDFSWAGKAVGGFIVLFGVSIVVVPMSVFTGYFLMNLQGDFYSNQVRFLKAEPKDLWQLKMRPSREAPKWRTKLFELLYEHLIQLEEGLRAKTNFLRDSISQKSLSKPFMLFKWISITASLVFALLTVLENSEYMNKDQCEDYAKVSARALFKGDVSKCETFVKQVDTVEYNLDLIFLHFFVLEFLLRVVVLGWRHFVSELGLAEMMSITGLLLSLTHLREDALHHVDKHEQNLMLGSVIFLRLTRLISIGSYFGLLRALRKVTWIARWSLLKSLYFLVAVWFTHAMLLHFAESKNNTPALAGAQILPAAPPGTLWMAEEPQLNGSVSFLQNESHSNISTNSSNLTLASTDVNGSSNVTNASNVTKLAVPGVLDNGYSSATHVLVNLTSQKAVLRVPKMRKQSHRYSDYLSAMQYSLQHLTGDYPIVEYSILGRLVLLLGLIVGTCAMAAWTAVFSSSMVNYLANEAEDQVARAAERRMLLAIDVVLRLQRQWRRRKRAREAALARGETPAPAIEHPEEQSSEGFFLRIRNKARRLVLRHTATGERLVRFFQCTLVFNVAFNMIFSLPELRGNEQLKNYYGTREEFICTLIFSSELILMLLAGKGRQGNRWYIFRFVDLICIFPGVLEIYQMRDQLHEIHKVDQKLVIKKEDWVEETHILIDAFQMTRVIRVLFWHQWRHEVQVVVDGIVSAGPILVLPAFLSMLTWVMSSALFVWMENVYAGPSKDFFTSVSTGMYWTSSFLIGEWTLADFSPGGGNRVCIFIVLFGIMAFGVATGILMEGVQQAIAVAMVENTSFEDLAKMAEAEKASSRSLDKAAAKEASTEGRMATKTLALPTGRSAQLRRAAKVAQMTKRMAEQKQPG